MGDVEVDGWFLGSEMAMATDLVASEHNCRSNSFSPKLVGGRVMGGEEGAWRVGHKKVDWTPGRAGYQISEMFNWHVNFIKHQFQGFQNISVIFRLNSKILFHG